MDAQEGRKLVVRVTVHDSWVVPAEAVSAVVLCSLPIGMVPGMLSTGVAQAGVRCGVGNKLRTW